MKSETWADYKTFKVRLTILERKVDKLDDRLWAIIILLVCNLGGILGILISINKLIN